MMPAGLPTQRNRRFLSALALLDHTVYGLIAERRHNGPKGPDDLLSMLMAAQDQDQPTDLAGAGSDVRPPTARPGNDLAYRWT